jgi:hypothetical protein
MDAFQVVSSSNKILYALSAFFAGAHVMRPKMVVMSLRREISGSHGGEYEDDSLL